MEMYVVQEGWFWQGLDPSEWSYYQTSLGVHK